MNRTLKYGVWVVIAILSLTACGPRGGAKNEIGGADKETALAVKSEQKGHVPQADARPVQFSVPEIPSYLQDPEAQFDFILDHFWDRMNFTDTIQLSQNPQAIAQYIQFLNQAPLEKGQASLQSFIAKGEGREEVVSFLLDKLKLFLMDPNSPIRNDELYEPVCQYIIEHASEMDPEKFQAEVDLKFIRINRRGTLANDFTVQDLHGRRVNLHSIQSPFTFVVFYNPDCHGCDESMAYIKASPILNSEPVKAMMKIVAVYVDQSPEIWERAKEMIPDDWISLWDREGRLREEEIYDLKAIPTLYLLDKDKKILLKDANLPDVENYFSSLFRSN